MASVVTTIGPSDHGRPMSLDDFEHAEVQEGYLYELGRGVITVSDVPHPRHMAIVLAIRDQLIAHKFAHPGRIHAIAAGSECKILLADLQSERHPDLSIYKTPPPDGDDVWSIWIPELVVEVVSPGSRERDTVEKREEYLAFGVQEYWIIDPEQGTFLALRRYRGRWREQAATTSATYTTPLFKGLSLDLTAILPSAPRP